MKREIFNEYEDGYGKEKGMGKENLKRFGALLLGLVLAFQSTGWLEINVPASVAPSGMETKRFTEPSGGRMVADGNYHIVSAMDKTKGLNVEDNSSKNGTNINIRTNTTDDNQVFSLVYTEDGYYQITKGEKSIDLASKNPEEDTNLRLWEDTGEDKQRWVIKNAGDGTYNIISKETGMYVGVEFSSTKDGANVLLENPNGGVSQKWKFEEWEPKTSQAIADGDYYIVSAMDEKMGLGADGSNIALRSNIKQSNNVFRLEKKDEGLYMITLQSNGKCLDVKGGIFASNTNVQLWSRNDTQAQRWMLRKSGNGYYNICSWAGFLALDIYGGQANDKQNAIIYPLHDGKNQRWKFVAWKPEKVTGLKLKKAGKQVIEGSFKKVNGVSEYQISCTVGDTTKTAITQKDTFKIVMYSGKRATVKVRAKNGESYGPWSSQVSCSLK